MGDKMEQKGNINKANEQKNDVLLVDNQVAEKQITPTLDKGLHIALIEASALHKKVCRQHFADLGLTEGQPKVFSYLKYSGGCLQKDLAYNCHVEPATMTVILRKMFAEEYVTKKAVYVSGGKRAFMIELTAKGEEIAKKVDNIVLETENLCFKNFSVKEQEELIELLKKMSNNLKTD